MVRKFGLFLFLVLIVLPGGLASADDHCGIPGQYSNSAGECVCPEGKYMDRGPVACVQTECPPNAGRTYTMECKCPDGLVSQSEQKSTETGFEYNLMVACVDPATINAQASGLSADSSSITDYFLPSPQRVSDAWDSMTHSGDADILERTAGVASLAGAAAEVVLTFTGLMGAARVVGAKVSGWWAARQASKAAIQAAGKVSARAGAASLSRISQQTASAMRSLITHMRKAGIDVTRDNLLTIINQARAAEGLVPWGKSSLEIVLKGIGQVIR